VTERLIDVPFVVHQHEHGSRVDMFLSRRVKRMSRSLVARVIRIGNVRKEPSGEVLDKPSVRVFVGETVVMKRKPLDEGPTDDIEIPILFEDDHVVAVCKPGDLVVHPTASAYHRTLIRILRERMNDHDLDLAHRIDKETSGLVLLGRDNRTAAHLTQQFARREVDKSYLAVVDGLPRFEEETVDVPLRLVPDSLTSCLMEAGGAGAQPALTRFTVLARGDGAALVRAEPKTGRQHQIRVHLLHLGHRILGDKLYFEDEALFIDAVAGRLSAEELTARIGHHRQALHNFSATFHHPGIDERITVEAPPPPDFWALLERRSIAWHRAA
jgi:23S rRNA pseudouridine1911/1915/1917 synthase